MREIPDTPVLDRAVDNELTTGEVQSCLIELSLLNGGGSCPTLVVDHRAHRLWARIDWKSMTNYQGKSYETIEDALVSERDDILRAIRETV